MPIYLFHGNKDKDIPFESSVRIKEIIKDTDELIVMEGLGHDRRE